MPGAFWDSWQLWEKMCFVLASGIVVVICLGCLKLLYNHWRLRKYTAIAAQKATVKQEMRRSASAVTREKAREIPFGIRALEKGVEVDGVWVSCSNTPVNSTPGSPSLSASSTKPKLAQRDLLSGRASSSSHMTRIEIPSTAYDYHSNGLSRPESSSRPTESPIERIFSAQKPAHRHLSMAPEQRPHGRPTYQPRRSSGLRFSDSLNSDQTAALAALQGRHFLAESKGKQSKGCEQEAQDGKRRFSWSGSSESENQDNTSQPSSSEVSADSLHYPTYHSPASEPRTSQESNPFITPSQTSAWETIAADPSTEIYDPRMQHAQYINKGEIAYDDGHAQPLQPFDANRQSRQSQVIRKINSGFEILRPGTLDQPRESVDPTEWKEYTGGKGKPNKLQRKNRRISRSPSVDKV